MARSPLPILPMGDAKPIVNRRTVRYRLGPQSSRSSRSMNNQRDQRRPFDDGRDRSLRLFSLIVRRNQVGRCLTTTEKDGSIVS